MENVELTEPEDEAETAHPRRNPPRERNRPQYLRDDMEKLIG